MKSSDEARRLLTIRIDQLERANKTQKEKREKAEHTLQEEIKKNKDLEQTNKNLERTLDNLKKQIIKYKDMLFGSQKKEENADTDPHTTNLPTDTESSRVSSLRKTSKAGGQPGHTGHHTKKSLPDTTEHLSLNHCNACGTPLQHGHSVESHTVTEIPHPESQRATTTQYDIERQWCSQCGKEVHASPPSHVLPGIGFGINLLTTVLAWRNHFHDPLNKMVERLKLSYGVDIPAGSLQNMLVKGQALLKRRHEVLLAQVRASPIKHVDETGWRVNGEKAWVFGYSTDTLTYYEVSESRGGYALHDMLYDTSLISTPSQEETVGMSQDKSLLLSDSYGVYDHIPFDHQSCWSHHLRVSHEASVYLGASSDAHAVHTTLCTIFDFLLTENQKPFMKEEREIAYAQTMQRIDTFLSTPYQQEDACAVQTRIRNQRDTLARALLHEGAPLTNNQAERDVRPMVIKRKISGGSRSWKGANATATNTSITATIHKQNLPLFNTLQAYLLGNVE